MKKTLFILCLFLCLPQSFWVAFWCEENVCSIWDAPAKVLTDYVTDVWKLINNISREARADGNKKILGNIKSQTLRITNATAGFSGYFSSFDYYVAYPIGHNVPYQIERDHKLLLSQNIRILNAIKKILKSGWWSVPIENLCDGIDASKCSLEWESAESILAALLKNNRNIIYLYQRNILWKTQGVENNFIFVENDFEREIAKHYGPDNVKSCASCEWSFEDTVTKSIKNIWNITENSAWAVDKWKYAWAVLGGNEQSAQAFLTRWEKQERSDYYNQSLGLWEEEVLKRYLWETWAGAKASEVALQNLERYNKAQEDAGETGQGGEQLSTSNPLENTARSTFSDIKTQIDSFGESISQSYEESGWNSFPTLQLQWVQNEIEVTQNIQENIKELYDTQKSINIVQDTTAENLIAKMIQMHFNLTNSINVLSKITETSEKVCNAQWKWLWLCSYQ